MKLLRYFDFINEDTNMVDKSTFNDDEKKYFEENSRSFYEVNGDSINATIVPNKMFYLNYQFITKLLTGEFIIDYKIPCATPEIALKYTEDNLTKATDYIVNLIHLSEIVEKGTQSTLWYFKKGLYGKYYNDTKRFDISKITYGRIMDLLDGVTDNRTANKFIMETIEKLTGEDINECIPVSSDIIYTWKYT